MSLVHNERTKLLPAALNNMAVATMVTAIIAPVVGSLYGSPNGGGGTLVAARRRGWLFVGLALHVAAQGALGKLKP